MSEAYTFLDFETTGFKDPAAVSLAVERQVDGEVIFKKYYLINPEKPIDYGAYQVHGISFNDIKDKPNFAEIWSEIKEYIEDQYVVGHNASYDCQRVMVKQLERYGISYKPFTMICTMNNAKKMISKDQVTNYKLDTICDYFDIHLTDHHNAMADTEACRQIFNELNKLGKLETKEIV